MNHVNPESKNRMGALENEATLRQDIESRFLGRAAAATADGKMDEYRWAMDVSREAGEDAEALQGIVARRQSNARLRAILNEGMGAGVLPPLGKIFDSPADRFPGAFGRSADIADGNIALLSQSLDSINPIILALPHAHGVSPSRAPDEIEMIIPDVTQFRPETGPDALPGA